MSARNNVNYLMVTGLLFTLASCGGSDGGSSKKRQEVNTICEDVNCLSSVNWKIMLPGRSFPDKSRIDINGTTVLNECVSKQKYMIDRSTDPQSLTLENYYVPKRGELKIDVIDMGYDCDSYSTFISSDKLNFEFVKGAAYSEIQITL